MKNLLPQDGEAYYLSDFFLSEESSDLLEKLQGTIAWRQEPITLFGKKIMQPRLTAWYGDSGASYTYSGITMQPLPWTPELHQIKTKVEAQVGESFNSVLLNNYRHEKDSMGWHQDNEKALGPNPTIASISFGETRKFQLKHISENYKISIDLEPGSLLIMKGQCQDFWKHALPKRSKPLQARINLTFRKIKEPN